MVRRLAATLLVGVIGVCARASDIDRARAVADRLDRVVQPRFQQDDAGLFGISRLLTLRGHEGVSNAHFKPEEQELLKSANAAGLDYRIAFLSIGHAPGNYKQNGGIPRPAKQPKATESAKGEPAITLIGIGRRNNGSRPPDRLWLASPNAREAPSPEMSASIKKHLDRVKSGKPAEATLDKWLVVLRPVRAEKASCLNCHPGAKRGDTLGVMVYSVARDVLAESQASIR